MYFYSIETALVKRHAAYKVEFDVLNMIPILIAAFGCNLTSTVLVYLSAL